MYVNQDGVDISHVVRLHRKYHHTPMICYMRALARARREAGISGEETVKGRQGQEGSFWQWGPEQASIQVRCPEHDRFRYGVGL